VPDPIAPAARLHWTRAAYRRINARLSPIAFSVTLDDHAVIGTALEVVPGDRIVCLASAGDTPLNLLAAQPSQVAAVDIAEPQLHLTQLKLTALAHLDVYGMRQLLGLDRDGSPASAYAKIEPHLPAATRQFWTVHSRLLHRGIVWQGAVQRLGRIWGPLARWRGTRSGRLRSIEENPYLAPLLLRRPAPEQSLPPYLSQQAYGAIAANADRVSLHHADIREYLRSCAAASVDCFALSNVPDWLSRTETDALLAEIVRVARPGARVLLSAHRHPVRIPSALAYALRLDRAASRALLAMDTVRYFRHIMLFRVIEEAS
jgi:S-adenosylmethionine:diacylglycerol 3-amino-3-carboxypropyl transferase